LVWTGRLAKSRARTRLDKSDYVELVVMVDWDDDIDNTIFAVVMDIGLDQFNDIDNALITVKMDAGLDCFNGVMGSSLIRVYFL
jgi:hypothetical protein